ncbi:MAG: phenylalanine--tRNA ligase subunit beta [Deltaproteobacteria bacterium]|nr:phenylalanine--tRNA ligase subunit beta [Deltaproteobacteria bacterium]
MRLSLNWLADFVDVTAPASELAERLTMAGLEVEAVEEIAPDFSGAVVAKAVKVEPHPQADLLTIAEVDAGGRTYRLVCGAPNLQEGRIYPFAPPGAVLSQGRKLKPAKIRGVASEGMLLAEDELGISADHAGLMDIPQDLPLGQDVAEALKLADTVLEVAVTPNRPDCLSVLGLAREVAALLNQPLRHPEVIVAEVEEPAAPLARVTILDPVGCPRYAARLLLDLTVKPSPFWMRRRLHLAGIRAINNLVDVTNYVLLEYGQPLHGFDFRKLRGGQIVVRRPQKTEKTFVTLDGAERVLDSETLLICDRDHPVALAGIMGGLESEITPDTREVLIESAYFHPPVIRRTAKRLGLSTESSYRFERRVDPAGVIHALERAAQLMAALGGGRVLSGRIDEYPAPIYHPRLTLRVSRANQVLGTDLSRDEMAGLLKRLHLPTVVQDADTLAVQAPSFRGDLEREIDLIEEVARLRGYEHIPVTLPQGEVATPRPGFEVRLREQSRRLLLGLGFSEAINYSFQSERLKGVLGEAEAAAPALPLANPLSEEQAVMRISLLPGLLDTLRRNIHHQVRNVRLFELSKIFRPEPESELPREEQWLTGLMYGDRAEAAWNDPEEPLDFFDLKGVVETLLEGLLINEVSFGEEDLPPFLRRGARVYSRGRELGVLGEVAPDVSEKLDVDGAVWVFNLDFAALAEAALPTPLFTPLPRYPAVYRDIALVVDAGLPAARVMEALFEHGKPWLKEAKLFDVYTGDPIPAGKRSLAFRLIYRDPERTLTDEAVSRRHDAMVQALERELGAELR